MAERNSKTTFTGEELKHIIALVRELESADGSKQKGIRAKLRKIGLYWSEVASGMAYTIANLQNLFNNGTLKLSDSESHCGEVLPSVKMIKKEDVTPLRHINISTDKDIDMYKEDGFEGFIPVAKLREATSILPENAGVYVVIRKSDVAPQFLEKGTGGFFKGKNPNVSIEVLTDNYVTESKTVYIGKAANLRKRVGQLLSFGAGAAIGHWGGRFLWQLADSVGLIVAWKITPGCDPRAIETQMIRSFVSVHGKRPFANLKD
ncbi:GIY-YIG nuclease family protein [uncultured Bacteroides sp.]|mgnify:CR=1 FL=1|jgi:hypothetical protein|uniref:GIY-YIG nuclease family protein n=1 Tax=uncultured Bacteroides sp. TaxID=162156 RepID=UPI0026C78CDC